MSEMLERVARALCPEPDGPGRVTGDDGRCYPAGAPRWLLWEAEARAALAAMRKPTEAMEEKGAEALFLAIDLSKLDRREIAAEVWFDMIDEALRY